MTRRLLFHCQHSLGLGHLVRALALADGLAEHFDVTLLSGGRWPDGLEVLRRIDVVDLPSLGHDDAHRLVSHEPGRTVEEVQSERGRRVLDALERTAPDVIVVELYPFGRRKFEFELLPLLDAAAAMVPPPLVVSSVRDILVGRDDGGRHDERAVRRANRYLDAVLVHGDPAFARFEESFRPATPLEVPVHHTGFVVPAGATAVPPASVLPRVLVSAGGGMVGAELLSTAADAAPNVLARTGLTTTLVAGPFLPRLDRRRLEERSGPALVVLDRVADLCGEISRSTVSVSQGGYNTMMDVVRAGRPAVVVPFVAAGEDEQTTRAERLARLGLVAVLPPGQVTTASWTEAIANAARARRPVVRLDLDGRRRSARLIAELADHRRSVVA